MASFARGAIRASRVALAGARVNATRSVSTSAARKAAATGGAAAATFALGAAGASYCAWSWSSLFGGSSEVDYNAVYRDIVAM
jgi:hypothetical protein